MFYAYDGKCKFVTLCNIKIVFLRGYKWWRLLLFLNFVASFVTTMKCKIFLSWSIPFCNIFINIVLIRKHSNNLYYSYFKFRQLLLSRKKWHMISNKCIIIHWLADIVTWKNFVLCIPSLRTKPKIFTEHTFLCSNPSCDIAHLIMRVVWDNL